MPAEPAAEPEEPAAEPVDEPTTEPEEEPVDPVQTEDDIDPEEPSTPEEDEPSQPGIQEFTGEETIDKNHTLQWTLIVGTIALVAIVMYVIYYNQCKKRDNDYARAQQNA